MFDLSRLYEIRIHCVALIGFTFAGRLLKVVFRRMDNRLYDGGSRLTPQQSDDGSVIGQMDFLSPGSRSKQDGDRFITLYVGFLCECQVASPSVTLALYAVSRFLRVLVVVFSIGLAIPVSSNKDVDAPKVTANA
jgi:hypothetical protein